MSEWIQTKDREPKPGETILAHVRDCKLGDFFIMTVRSDEGTAFIDEYTIVQDIHEKIMGNKGQVMDWIQIKKVGDHPNPKLGKILVWAKCGCPHVAYYRDGSWNHTECCDEGENHFLGESIDFDFWMPVPEQPERLSEKDAVNKA